MPKESKSEVAQLHTKNGTEKTDDESEEAVTEEGIQKTIEESIHDLLERQMSAFD